MEKVYDKCCGVDVYKKLIVACLWQGRKQEVREFGATTRELLEMAQVSVESLSAIVEAAEKQAVNIKSFLKIVKKYTEPTELTPQLFCISL